jgi:hypothetical protein
MFLVSLFADLIGAHHSTELTVEARLLSMLVSLELFRAASAWVIYIAAEPHVRRIWPETMIGWNRLLMGHFRDPRVGRDVLVGLMAGLVLACAIHLGVVATSGSRIPVPIVAGPYLQLDLRHAFSWLGIVLAMLSTPIGLILALQLFLLVLILRTRTAATVAFALFGTVILRFLLFGGANPSLGFSLGALVAIVLLFVQVRFGSLAVIALVFARNLTTQVPISLAPAAAYAEWSYLIVGTILVLAAYGFHTALGGRPIFGVGLLNEKGMGS